MRRILHVGAGVWVCLRQEMKLILFHTTTHKVLQEVNVKSNFKNILKSKFWYKFQKIFCIVCSTGARITKLNGEHCHISNILATKGLLWLGTSLGITLVYRIPCLEGVPLISGRPYLAYDAHQDSVRVLLSMSVTSRPIRKRIASRVLREHVRKMNRPISALVTIEDDCTSRDMSPISDASNSYNQSEVVSDSLSKDDRDKIAQEVIEDLKSRGKVEATGNRKKKYHDYETLNWIGPEAKDQLIELTASQEATTSQEQSYDVPPDEETADKRRDSGDYETVEYPEDGNVIDVLSDLYTPMHPRHYSMSIPGKDDSIAQPTEDTQLVVTAGRGLTHFRKLRSRTVYQGQGKAKPAASTVKHNNSQYAYLIVYELDSTLRMFNPEETD